ncbi:phenylalanine--tRNA ligase subunit alpha [Thermogladius sp.]|uniref:phenylalanine--tRNA ligase subunit alpha n=1 Tax=Thermogladius sp. TaxID=2023064 RepID=UPI003D13A860
MAERVVVTKKQFEILGVVAELGSVDVYTLSSRIGLSPEDVMRDLAELAGKNLVELSSRQEISHELTEHGVRYLNDGLPEEQALKVFRKCLNSKISDFVDCLVKNSKLTPEDANVALQILVKSNCVKVGPNSVVVLGDEARCLELREQSAYLRSALSNISRGTGASAQDLETLKRRKMVVAKRKSIVVVRARGDLAEMIRRGHVVPGKLLTVVLPSQYKEAEGVVVKKFDLNVPPPSIKYSTTHPFMDFIKQLREILVSMGFEEVRGPHVEAEFWNFDVLFQPQDHPAREIHDTFFVLNKALVDVPTQALEVVKRVHEEGWKYTWDPSRALRLVLRTQCTAVSARTIYYRGGGEYRAFTIDRVFRPENLDAKHSMEFYQLDGIIVGKDVNFKHLLYFFKEFAAALGIKDVWFKPGYFPFTEPSVEGYIKHPVLGWVEVFPGGVFRPEVMEMLGAGGYKAVAWGIGVDRLAMWFMGIDDIRLLFAKDLDFLRSIAKKPLPYFLGTTSGRDVVVRPSPE